MTRSAILSVEFQKYGKMNRVDNFIWREACRRVDDAASFFEQTRLGVENAVWEARERWRRSACLWLDGEESLEGVRKAAEGFVSAVEAVAPPHALKPVYPFNSPGEPVLLYAGPMSVVLEGQSANGVEDVEATGEGRISIDFLPSPQVFWRATVEGVCPDLLAAFFRRTAVKPVLPQFGDASFQIPPRSGKVSALPNITERGGLKFAEALSSEPFGLPDRLFEVRFNLINCSLKRGTDLVLQLFGGSSLEDNSRFPKHWPTRHRMAAPNRWMVDRY